MVEIDLNKYAPCITNENVAKGIYSDIMKLNPFDNEILINMKEIISIDVHNILVIFGELYDNLGADKFHEHIVLKLKDEKENKSFLGDFIAYIINERNKRREEENKKK